MEHEAVTCTRGRPSAIGAVGALAVLGGMFIVAGCGGHSARSGVVSTTTVLKHFQVSTGQSLVVSRKQRASGLFKTKLDEVGLAKEDPDLGDFTITVYLNPDVAEREHFLRGGSVARTSIYWGRYRPDPATEPGYWVASRMYGNVLLTWRSPVRRTNEQWVASTGR